MPPRYDSSFPDEATALAQQQGGCLSSFLLPPLAVLCIGVVMAFLALGPGSASPSLAAAPVQSDAIAAPLATDPVAQVSPASLLDSTPVQDPADPSQPLGSPAQNDVNQTQGIPDGSALPTSISPSRSGLISTVFRPEILYWSGAIQTWATAAGLDPNLVATVMQIESCGDPGAHSRAGAMGLFQVMPYHFTASDDPYSPNTNATRGLAYLKRSLQAANGDARLALAGYNGGIGVISRPESTWAAETQRYAYWGSGIYAEASNGVQHVSLRLQEWIAAGGASLCRQARARLGINP